MSVTMYAILGFAMMLILTAVLVSGKFTPSIPMIVIPIILALASFAIYKKYYTLKGEKMEEITRKVNEMHAKKQTA